MSTHTDMSVAILGVGVAAPRVLQLSDLAAVCRCPGNAPKESESVPPPEGMSVRDQRRLARLTRLALYAADSAAAQAGARGRNAGIYMGLTHGTAAFLKEFHDFLFDYGPDMASPNAFSNGVTNAPLGAISLHLKLTEGGATLVGLESCGLDVLTHAASKVADGTHELCYAGAAEEYSPIVEGVYRCVGWYPGRLPERLPWPREKDLGVGVSEGSVVCLIGPAEKQKDRGVLFTPLDGVEALDECPDVVISGAGGGPQDEFELRTLRALCERFSSPVALLFPKPFFGETFSAAPLFSLALAWDILTNGTVYPSYPVHHSLASGVAPTYDPRRVRNVLLVAADREGRIALGKVSRLPA